MHKARITLIIILLGFVGFGIFFAVNWAFREEKPNNISLIGNRVIRHTVGTRTAVEYRAVPRDGAFEIYFWRIEKNVSTTSKITCESKDWTDTAKIIVDNTFTAENGRYDFVLQTECGIKTYGPGGFADRPDAPWPKKRFSYYFTLTLLVKSPAATKNALAYQTSPLWV